MPNISDIVEVAESLGSKSVYVASDRCVAVRNRHASCKACIAACPVSAITIASNQLTLDAKACVACGACTVVCPTDALLSLEPADANMAQELATAVDAAQGLAVFGCARIASKGQGDPAKFVAVPCLARMEESMLVELAAQQVEDIVLVDGTCKTCKYRACVPGIDAVVDSANQLIASMGGTARVCRISQFPAQAALEDASVLLGRSRRGFFSQATGFAKDAAVKSAQVALKDALPLAATDAPTLKQRLGASGGTLPQFMPESHVRLLDALDAIGAPVADVIDSRFFATVDIDAARCNACGMCTVFCPTGALAATGGKVAGGGTVLEFNAMQCVQCNLCQDVCLKRCLTVGSAVPTSQLFDFQPRTIKLPKGTSQRNFMASYKR